MPPPEIDAALVRRLVATQFPQWASLEVSADSVGGWDNRTFRLGGELSVRLPSGDWYALGVAKEQEWLPRLAPLLPLPVPTPVARGVPGEGYPYEWSVNRWIDGEPATRANVTDLSAFAVDLAEFLVALRQVDADGGPAPGPHNWFRGGPLTVYADETERALATLAAQLDVPACREVWGDALASAWQGEPVWFHGDVATGNLLVRNGRLAAVIDFGTSGVGDPACDVVVAWTLLDGPARDAFRAALGVDDATWSRGRGWALWKALITLADDPTQGTVIEAVLADHAATSSSQSRSPRS